MNGSHHWMSGLTAMMLMAAAPADAKTGTSAGAGDVVTNGAEVAAYGGATNARQPLICKRWANTGSRIAKQKACHTEAEWKRIEDGDY
jgi:hypothetical protein